MKLEKIHFNTRTYTSDLNEDKYLFEVFIKAITELAKNGLFMRSFDLDRFCRHIGFEDKDVKKACMYYSGLTLSQLVGLMQDLHGLALVQRIDSEGLALRDVLTPHATGVQRVNKVSNLFKKRSLKAFLTGLKTSKRGSEAWEETKERRIRFQLVLDHKNNKVIKAINEQ